MALRRPVLYIEPDAAAELLSSEEAQAVVAQAAVQIRDLARANNPSEDERPYIYAAHWRTSEGEPATAVVGYDSAIWHIIEFGSRNNPPYRPMTRAVEESGIEFHPGGE